MKIDVIESYRQEPLMAVFYKTESGAEVFYWRCLHKIHAGECIHCYLVIDEDESDE